MTTGATTRRPATDVLILGGGFAGVATARGLADAVRDAHRDDPGGPLARVRVRLVNRENYFVFQPLLTEVLSGSVGTTHVVVPLRRMLRGVNVEVAVVEAVDLDRRSVRIRARRTGDRLELRYHHLVLALGSVTDFGTIPGMAEHAVGLRTLGDAIYLRNRALGMLEEADLEPDDGRRRELTTFVVVGGGATGVEVATELYRLVSAAARAFREPRLDPRVVLVHSRDRLLPEFPAGLARYATRKTAGAGVVLQLGQRVASVDDHGVQLDDGSRVDAATVVSTVGNAPHPVLADLPCQTDERGWLRAEPTLAVPGTDGVWALGDGASIPDPRHPTVWPATAQHAVRQGAHLAENVVRAVRGEAPEPYHYHSKGRLVSLGTLKAAGEILGVKVAGIPAWLAWRGYYLSQLPTLDRRIRVLADWIAELVLPPDIVQIDLRRSRTRPGPSGVVDDGALELD